MELRLINNADKNAYYNMALDETLLRLSDKPVLRFYTWKPRALSLGYFQKIRDVDLSYCKKNKIDVVRRLTGGKAVFHDKELTYSFVISKYKMPKSVVESYKKISLPILKALNNLGIKARFKDKDVISSKSPVCLNNPSWYEIMVGGRKIVAGAQKRLGNNILQHGSILFDIDFEKQCRVFSDFNDELVEKTKERITCVKKYNPEITKNKIIKELIKQFSRYFKAEIIDDDLSYSEENLVNELINKYNSKEWNKRN